MGVGVGVGAFHIQQLRSSSIRGYLVSSCILMYFVWLSWSYLYLTAQQEELIQKARETEKSAKARLAEIQQNMKVWLPSFTFSCAYVHVHVCT